MRRASACGTDEDIEEIFGVEYAPGVLPHWDSVGGYRTRTVKSGNMLEMEIFPVPPRPQRGAKRAKKEKASRDTQRRLNNKNAIKRVVRLINANFTDADLWGSYTYDDAHRPASEARAEKNMQNYVKSLKRYIARHPDIADKGFELKYIYITEYNDDNADKIRIHHHIVTNFPDRDVAERLWKGGARTKTQRLQADECGYEGLARYITKDPKGKKRYCASRNLKPPIVSVSDTKITRRRARNLLFGKLDAKEYTEKVCKGYRFVDMTAYVSDITAGMYLYIRMRR